MKQIKPKVCKVCQTNKTYRIIDGIPVCDECLKKDAVGGRVKDYSGLRGKK